MSDAPILVGAREASERLGIHPRTLQRWATTGRVDFDQTAGGHRRYDVERIRASLRECPRRQTGHEPPQLARSNAQKRAQAPSLTVPSRVGVIYARVSSRKQQDDLQRQVEALKDRHPDFEVVTDICSGLNYKRRGLTRLLERVQKGLVNTVVVAHKDRLARFGAELIQWVIEQAGATLVIDRDDRASPEQELTQDLMAIVHVFSCRSNDRRRYRVKGAPQRGGEKGTKRSLSGQVTGGEEASEGVTRPRKKARTGDVGVHGNEGSAPAP